MPNSKKEKNLLAEIAKLKAQLAESSDLIKHLLQPAGKSSEVQTLPVEISYFDEDFVSVSINHNELQFSIRQWRTWLLDISSFCLANPHHDLDKLGFLISDLNEFCKIVEAGISSVEIAA